MATTTKKPAAKKAAAKPRARKAAVKKEEPAVAAAGSVEPVAAPVATFEVDGDHVKVNGKWIDLDAANRSVDALREATQQAHANRSNQVESDKARES